MTVRPAAPHTLMTSLSICVLQLHNAQRTARQAAQGAGFGSEPPYVIGPWSRFPALWLAGKETPTFHMQACYVSGSVTGGQSVCVFMYQRVSSVCYSVCSPPLLVVCSLCSLCLDVCCVLLSSLHFPWQQILSAFPLLILSPGFFGRTFCSQTSFRLFLFVSLSFSFCGTKWRFYITWSVRWISVALPKNICTFFWRSRVLACAKLTSLWWLGVASIEMFGVSKIILFYLLIVLFIKDALNWSHVTAKTFIRFIFQINAVLYFLFISIIDFLSHPEINHSLSKILSSTTVFNIYNRINVSWAANQHIRMNYQIRSDDAENSALHHRNKSHFTIYSNWKGLF